MSIYDIQTASYPITTYSATQNENYLEHHAANGKASCTNFSLFEPLTEFRQHHASDSRDKVYSFLGMTSGRPYIIIDYATDAISLFKSVARRIIDTGYTQNFASVESNYDPHTPYKELPS